LNSNGPRHINHYVKICKPLAVEVCRYAQSHVAPIIRRHEATRGGRTTDVTDGFDLYGDNARIYLLRIVSTRPTTTTTTTMSSSFQLELQRSSTVLCLACRHAFPPVVVLCVSLIRVLMKVPVGRPLPLLPLSGTHSTRLEAASSGCLAQ